MRRRHLIAWLAVAGLFVWVFGSALLGGGIWVFRDAGHYYYPLYQFTGEQLATGTPALWNPYENLGMPLVANPTSALFYPPAWIFALPIDPAWAYRLYVLGHFALALATCYGLARNWKASPTAAMAAAASYAFCGNVLYQVCNVVYLVGAAWMPLALLACDRMLRRRSVRAAVAFGAVLAAMTLGGDPQAGYHAGLLAVLYAIVLWCRQRFGRGTEEADGEEGDASGDSTLTKNSGVSAVQVPHGVRDLLLLSLAAVTAFCLAAVQVLPSMQFTRISSRQSSNAPRSVYELVSADKTTADLPQGRHWSDGLLHRRVDRAMHHGQVYHFSIGPWRLAEYVWPNVMGRQFPTHRHWADAIPSEGRIWVPSLYMGIVPLLLALLAMRFRKGDSRTVWLSWTALLCVVGSLGWFGVGWLLREVYSVVGADPATLPVGPPFGGLYWLMTVLLPGYVYFRYPAKLLTLAAVAFSLLTAVGWDHAFAGAGARFRRVVSMLGWLSLVGTIIATGVWWFAPTVFQHVEPNIMFGPLDAYGAAADILMAFAQTTVVLFLFGWLLGRAGGQPKWSQLAVLLLVVFDLGIANGWMVPTADARLWRQPTELAAMTGQASQTDGDVRPARIYRKPGWLPEEWSQRGSAKRLEEVLIWDRATGAPKHNLSDRFAVSEVYGTMLPQDYQVFLWYIKHRGGGTIPFASDLEASAVDFALLSPGEALEDAADKPEDGAGQGPRKIGLVTKRASLWTMPEAMPRAWFVPDVEVLPPLDTDNWRTLWRRTEQVFHPQGKPRDLRQVAVVEATPHELDAAGFDESARDASTDKMSQCRIVSYEPTRIEVEVATAGSGLVVLADQYFPGWEVELETAGQGARRAPVLRANRVMRGVWVDRGEHRLVFRYRPRGVVQGGILSAMGWFLVGLLAIISFTRAARTRKTGTEEGIVKY